MSCNRVQGDVSGAIDDGRDLTACEDHLSVCSDCRRFASVSQEIASRYRRRVTAGMDRLRRSPAPVPATRSSLRPIVVLAAALLIALSLPVRPAPGPAPAAGPTADARIPLFDGDLPGPMEVPVLAWSGEPPLPRRLDQDLPPSLFVDLEAGVALPTGLRF